MAQMEWNKYPEIMPPADDIYLAVQEFNLANRPKMRTVNAVCFAHDLSEISEHDLGSDHRAGWYDASPDFYNEVYEYSEMGGIIYWMPFPEAPED